MASGRTIWADQLQGPERSALARRDALERQPDVLVVGGGIVGVATALACHQAGLGRVSLVEAGRLGSGATAGAAGLLVPEAHQGSDPPAFVELARVSLGLWRELESAIAGGVGYKDMDWFGLAPRPERFVADPPATVKWLTGDDMAQLVPGLTPKTPAALGETPGPRQPIACRQPHGRSAASRGHRRYRHRL